MPKLILKYMLLIEVTGVICLHSLTPHLHHGEMSDKAHRFWHNQENHILTIIGSIFHDESTHFLIIPNLSIPLNKTLSKLWLSNFICDDDFNLINNTRYGCIFLNQKTHVFHDCTKTSCGLRAPPKNLNS